LDSGPPSRTRKAATARFVKTGTPFAARDRAIVIELLAPPVGPLPNTSGLPDAFDRPGIEKLFDNERVTIWRYTWQPHRKTPRHSHANDPRGRLHEEELVKGKASAIIVELK
jgi:hypothetical protein